MLRPIAMLAGLVVPFGAETYHAACVAFDPAAKTAFVSDPFEQECTDPAACRRQVTEKWTAYLRKEGLAQSAGVTHRCEMYREGSTPDESPRSRVRKWRDEEVAQTQSANRGKYTRVTMTAFELD